LSPIAAAHEAAEDEAKDADAVVAGGGGDAAGGGGVGGAAAVGDGREGWIGRRSGSMIFVFPR